MNGKEVVAPDAIRKVTRRGRPASVTVSAATAADRPRVAPPETDVTQLYIVGLRDLAEAGNAEAQNELGLRDEGGRGVAQDNEEAARWYRRAAEQGNPHGQHNLGFMHQTGRGVMHDYEKAVRWYRRTADQGDTSAAGAAGATRSPPESRLVRNWCDHLTP